MLDARNGRSLHRRRKREYSAPCYGARILKYVDKSERQRFTVSPASHGFVPLLEMIDVPAKIEARICRHQTTQVAARDL